MFKKLFMSAVLTTLMLGAVHPAMAADHDQDITIDNQTGWAITALYVEPESNTADWGEEWLKGATIASGDAYDCHFTGYGDDCEFAISVTDPAGKSWEVRNIDICKVSKVKFTVAGGKVKWTAE
jgi:hypothetical protein